MATTAEALSEDLQKALDALMDSYKNMKIAEVHVNAIEETMENDGVGHLRFKGIVAKAEQVLQVPEEAEGYLEVERPPKDTYKETSNDFTNKLNSLIWGTRSKQEKNPTSETSIEPVSTNKPNLFKELMNQLSKNPTEAFKSDPEKAKKLGRFLWIVRDILNASASKQSSPRKVNPTRHSLGTVKRTFLEINLSKVIPAWQPYIEDNEMEFQAAICPPTLEAAFSKQARNKIEAMTKETQQEKALRRLKSRAKVERRRPPTNLRQFQGYPTTKPVAVATPEAASSNDVAPSTGTFADYEAPKAPAASAPTSASSSLTPSPQAAVALAAASTASNPITISTTPQKNTPKTAQQEALEKGLPESLEILKMLYKYMLLAETKLNITREIISENPVPLFQPAYIPRGKQRKAVDPKYKPFILRLGQEEKAYKHASGLFDRDLKEFIDSRNKQNLTANDTINPAESNNLFSFLKLSQHLEPPTNITLKLGFFMWSIKNIMARPKPSDKPDKYAYLRNSFSIELTAGWQSYIDNNGTQFTKDLELPSPVDLKQKISDEIQGKPKVSPVVTAAAATSSDTTTKTITPPPNPQSSCPPDESGSPASLTSSIPTQSLTAVATTPTHSPTPVAESNGTTNITTPTSGDSATVTALTNTLAPTMPPSTPTPNDASKLPAGTHSLSFESPSEQFSQAATTSTATERLLQKKIAKIKRLVAAKQKLQGEFDQIKTEVAEVREKNRVLENTLSTHTKTITKLQGEKSELEQEVIRQHSDLEKKVSLQGDLETARTDTKNFQAQLVEQQRLLTTKQEEYTIADNERRRLKEKLADSTEVLREKAATIGHLTTQLGEANNQLSSNSANAATVLASEAQNATMYAAAQAELVTLRNKLKAIEQERIEERQRFETERNQVKTALNTALQDKEKVSNEKNIEILSLREQLTEARQQLSANTASVSEASKSTQNTAASAAVPIELTEIHKQLENERKEKKAAEDMIKHLEAELKAAKLKAEQDVKKLEDKLREQSEHAPKSRPSKDKPSQSSANDQVKPATTQPLSSHNPPLLFTGSSASSSSGSASPAAVKPTIPAALSQPTVISLPPDPIAPVVAPAPDMPVPPQPPVQQPPTPSPAAPVLSGAAAALARLRARCYFS